MRAIREARASTIKGSQLSPKEACAMIENNCCDVSFDRRGCGEKHDDNVSWKRDNDGWELVIGRQRWEREHSGKSPLYTINSPHCQGKEAASYCGAGVRGLKIQATK